MHPRDVRAIIKGIIIIITILLDNSGVLLPETYKLVETYLRDIEKNYT